MTGAAHAVRPKYRAQFFDGWSLAAADVEVELLEAGVRICDGAGAERALWTASGLQCDAMQQGGVLHVSHVAAAQETLVVRDAVLAQRLVAMGAHVSALPGGERQLRYALLCLGAVVLLGAAAYNGMPLFARAVAVRIPLEHERALGTQVEAVLELSSCDDPAAEASLRLLERRLLGEHDRATDMFEVRLVKSAEPNAFALPGGVIVLTSGLVEQAETPDEVAGVLAHEIEHVVHRHVLTGFIRDALLSGLWAVSVGDYSGLLVVDPTTAYRVANLKFSRDDEETADREAVARLHRAGMSHAGLITFFERLQAEADLDAPAWMSTHPATAERIERLRRMEDVRVMREVLDREGFEALRGCGTARD